MQPEKASRGARRTGMLTTRLIASRATQIRSGRATQTRSGRRDRNANERQRERARGETVGVLVSLGPAGALTVGIVGLFWKNKTGGRAVRCGVCVCATATEDRSQGTIGFVLLTTKALSKRNTAGRSRILAQSTLDGSCRRLDDAANDGPPRRIAAWGLLPIWTNESPLTAGRPPRRK